MRAIYLFYCSFLRKQTSKLEYNERYLSSSRGHENNNLQ